MPHKQDNWSVIYLMFAILSCGVLVGGSAIGVVWLCKVGVFALIISSFAILAKAIWDTFGR
jgi:hypothetical protein